MEKRHFPLINIFNLTQTNEQLDFIFLLVVVKISDLLGWAKPNFSGPVLIYPNLPQFYFVSRGKYTILSYVIQLFHY